MLMLTLLAMMLKLVEMFQFGEVCALGIILAYCLLIRFMKQMCTSDQIIVIFICIPGYTVSLMSIS